MTATTGNAESFGASYEKEFEKLRREHPKPVILVAGATGAGKSTLVNLVFGREVAVTGAGKPVTRRTDKFENEFVVLYDSRGYERGEAAQEEFFMEVGRFIEERRASVAEAVNIAWYCVSAPAARFLEVDGRLLEFFRKEGIPAALVLTQVDCAGQEQLDELEAEARRIDSRLPVFLSTTDQELAPFLADRGLEKLYRWTLEHMEGPKRRAFRAACNRDLSEKRSEGHAIAGKHAAAAFGIGFTPIPCADAPLLVAAQMRMIARISYVWGLDLIPILTAGGVLDLALTTLGKTAAGQLLKLIPGVGSLAGGLINGSVGGALTYGLGAAINESCHQYCKMQLEGKAIDFPDCFSPQIIMELIKKFSEQYYEAEGKKGA